MAGFRKVIKTPGATDSHFMGFLNGPCCLTLLDTSLQIVALTDSKEGYFQCTFSELCVSKPSYVDKRTGHSGTVIAVSRNSAAWWYQESCTGSLAPQKSILQGGGMWELPSGASAEKGKGSASYMVLGNIF